MSVQWQYVPNEDHLEVFCPHCSDFPDTPYFTSEPDGETENATEVCWRCARVLVRCYNHVDVDEDLRTKLELSGGR